MESTSDGDDADDRHGFLHSDLDGGSAFKWAWWVLQWPVVFALVATGIGLVYYFAPDVEQDWVWITTGSILATVLWVLVSLAFKLYIATFGNYNETYGTLGAFIVVLTWFYLSGLAILIGAEFDAEIEHASPYGKAPGEKVPGEKRKIGALAQRDYDERQARGEVAVSTFPDGVNCDLDRETPREDRLGPADYFGFHASGRSLPPQPQYTGSAGFSRFSAAAASSFQG